MDSNTLAQQLATYDAGRKSSADILNSAMSQYGVPEIRSRVAGLRTTLSNTESALNNVDPSVTGRTSRSLVTEAQRQRMVANERAPIAAQYGQQQGALSNESANLNDEQQAAQALAQGQIQDYTTGRNALQSQYDAAVSREAEVRRQQEADRAYQLQVQQQADANRNAAADRYAKASGSEADATPSSQQRSGGGFNFQDASGNAISARRYAQLTGTNFNTLLKKMASAGDSGAADVLKNGGSSRAYQALTWN